MRHQQRAGYNAGGIILTTQCLWYAASHFMRQLSESKIPRAPPAVAMSGSSSAFCLFIMNKVFLLLRDRLLSPCLLLLIFSQSLYIASAGVPAPARKIQKDEPESPTGASHPVQLHLLAPPPLICKTFKLENEFKASAGFVINLAASGKYCRFIFFCQLSIHFAHLSGL